MKTISACFSLLLLLGLMLTPSAQAQVSLEVDFIPFVGYGGKVPNQVADEGSMSIGAQAHLGLRGLGRASIKLNPVADVYLIQSDASGLELSLNLLLALGSTETAVNPWIGIGGKLARVSGTDPQAQLFEGSDIGLNLIAGSAFGAGNIRPFAQVWYTLGDIGLYLEENFGPTGGTSLGFQGGIAFRLTD